VVGPATRKDGTAGVRVQFPGNKEPVLCRLTEVQNYFTPPREVSPVMSPPPADAPPAEPSSPEAVPPPTCPPLNKCRLSALFEWDGWESSPSSCLPPPCPTVAAAHRPSVPMTDGPPEPVASFAFPPTEVPSSLPSANLPPAPLATSDCVMGPHPDWPPSVSHEKEAAAIAAVKTLLPGLPLTPEVVAIARAAAIGASSSASSAPQPSAPTSSTHGPGAPAASPPTEVPTSVLPSTATPRVVGAPLLLPRNPR